MMRIRCGVRSDRKGAGSTIYFSYADQVRRWLEERHVTEIEILVDFCY
jgi:hypothetical protein